MGSTCMGGGVVRLVLQAFCDRATKPVPVEDQAAEMSLRLGTNPDNGHQYKTRVARKTPSHSPAPGCRCTGELRGSTCHLPCPLGSQDCGPGAGSHGTTHKATEHLALLQL